MAEKKILSLEDYDAFPRWKEIITENPDYIGIWSPPNYSYPIENAFAVFVEEREDTKWIVTYRTHEKNTSKPQIPIPKIFRTRPKFNTIEEEKEVHKIRGRIEDRLGNATFCGFEVPEVKILFYKIYNPEGLDENAIKHPLIYEGTITGDLDNGGFMYRGDFTRLDSILFNDLIKKFDRMPFGDNSDGYFRMRPFKKEEENVELSDILITR